jgi:hypothetical protein
MTDLLKICKSQYSLEGLRANMMALSPQMAVSSFFDEGGSPYTMQEICERAQRGLKHARPEDTSRVRRYVEYLKTPDFALDVGRRFGIWLGIDLVHNQARKHLEPKSLKDQIRDSLMTQVVIEVSLAAAIMLSIAGLDYKDKRKVMQAFKDKIGQNIRAWEMEKDTIRDFPKGIHRQIQQGCGDLDSTSIRDIRAWVMTHHPNAFAQVLIHPSGRLFTEREICIALKIYGKSLKAKQVKKELM